MRRSNTPEMELPAVHNHRHLKQLVLFCFLMTSIAVQGQIRYSIPEETEKGYFVGNLAEDLGLSIKELSERGLRVVSRGKTSYFAFSLSNGYLYLNEEADREQICAQISPCLLQVEFISQNPVALYKVEVEIQDINDNAPTFPEVELLLEISEISAPGAHWSLLKASDPDIGVNSIQKYTLQQNTYFKLGAINEAGDEAEPELVLEKTLDREKMATHHLVLTAADGGTPARSGTLQIRVLVLDINDNAPVFSHSVYKVNVMEDVSEGTMLTTVTASDSDEGSNAEVVYSFSKVLSSVTSLFDLNSKTGDLYLKGKLDFEETQIFDLKIQARDIGGLVAQSKILIVVIDINDNPPVISITTLSSPVSEDSAPGTVVAVFNVQDRDSGNNCQITCSIPDNIPFQLKPSFDNYYSLVTDQSLDREQAVEYTIAITAEDHGKPALSTTTKIVLQISDINDNTPVFDHASYTAYIMENNPRGASIFSAKATDADWGQNAKISYSLIVSFKQADHMSSYVSINSDTGVIYALRSFDYEQLKELHIQVKAQDRGFPTLSSNVTVFLCIVDQNDNAPQILYPSLAMDGSTGVELASRSSVPDYLITKVVAVDTDSGQNAWLSYHLQRDTSSGLFTVGQHNGEIRTSRAILEKDAIKHTFVISAKDNGTPALSATVTVTVFLSETIPEMISEDSIPEPSRDSESSITLYLVIAIALVSCLFLAFLIALMILKILKWKNSKPLSSGNIHCTGLPASQFVGIDGVRAFLEAYSHDMTLKSYSENTDVKVQNALSTNTCNNNLTPLDRDLILLQDGSVAADNATSEVV
ncbi:protocadherin gamma-A11-like [Lissotriton helveticus]